MEKKDFRIPYPKERPNEQPSKIRFVIKSVYPGSKYEDTVITEIYQCGG